MGTTYQQPHYGTYAGRPDVQYQAGLRPNGQAEYAAVNPSTRAVPSLSHAPAATVPYHGSKMDSSVTYATYTRPVSPPQPERNEVQPQQQKAQSSDQIMSNLQIPKTISKAGGSLAEFAAQVCGKYGLAWKFVNASQITCLFWFETTDTLKDAENVGPSTIVPRLKTDALPTTGFRKWVVTTLTTTQVSQNVILLALLFIYRLKNINPGVKGRAGSEYRLLTVALMLGNKCMLPFLTKVVHADDL